LRIFIRFTGIFFRETLQKYSKYCIIKCGSDGNAIIESILFIGTVGKYSNPIFFRKGIQIGVVGLRPKCKMQNAKCKIGERKNEATQTGNQGFSFLG
jgi:hypothetical protein